MRWTLLLISVLSFNAYSGADDFPCKPSEISDWEAYKYILCPLLTTVSIPLSIIAVPTGSTIAGTSITGDTRLLLIASLMQLAMWYLMVKYTLLT